MNNKEIIQYVKDHPSGKVKIAFTDIDGILRGKYISTDKFLSVIENGMGFCDVIFGWDAGDVTYDNVQYTGCIPATLIHPRDWTLIHSERYPGKMMSRSFLGRSMIRKEIPHPFAQDNY